MKKVLSVMMASLIMLSSFPTMTQAALPSDSRVATRNVAHTVYVSPNGSDSNNGSQANPFQTIQRAKTAVRDLGKSSGDIVVKIADGFYPLDETIIFDEKDSGSENCTIYYEAAEGANPIISGGKILDSEWVDATDDVDWLAPGVTAYKATLERDAKLRAIYVNGERASMTKKSGKPSSAVGSYNVTKDQADWAWRSGSGLRSGNVFDSSFNLPADAKNPQNIELESGSTWVKATVCAESLELNAAGNTQVNFQMPYAAIAQNLGWNTGFNAAGNNDVINVFEWLSKPGEFYFDQAGSTLYYIPQEGENMSTAEVVIPELETLIDIKGSTPKSIYAQHITFRGLAFAHSDWNLQTS